MTRYLYQFSIQEIDIIQQRSAAGDTDADIVRMWLTSSIGETAKTAITPSIFGTFVNTGQRFFPDNDAFKDLKVQSWLGDGDMVLLHANIKNFSHQGDSTREIADSFKLTAAVAGLIVAGAELLAFQPLADKLGDAGQTLHDIAESLGPVKQLYEFLGGLCESIADLLEVVSSPNCDGTVFESELGNFFTAAFLNQQTGGKIGGSFTFTVLDDSQLGQSKCANPVTQITVLATLLDIADPPPPPSFGEARTSKTFEPLVGGHIQNFVGTWGDQDIAGNCRVLCDISAPTADFGDDFDARMQMMKARLTHAPATLTLLGGDPFTRDQSVLSGVTSAPPTLAADPIARLLPMADVTVTERVGSPTGSVAVSSAQQTVTHIPMQVPVFAQRFAPVAVAPGAGRLLHGATFSPATAVAGLHPLPPGAGFTTSPVPAAAPTASAAAPTPGGAEPTAGATGVLQQFESGLRFAETIALSDGICLQFYAGLDDAGIVEQRLRYIRTDGVGQPITDVMLTRTQPSPR